MVGIPLQAGDDQTDNRNPILHPRQINGDRSLNPGTSESTERPKQIVAKIICDETWYVPEHDGRCLPGNCVEQRIVDVRGAQLEDPLQAAVGRDRLDPAVRDRLFSVATEAFVRDGYERASLNAILAEAGVGKSTFFYYFVDKEDLFASLIEAAVARIASLV